MLGHYDGTTLLLLRMPGGAGKERPASCSFVLWCGGARNAGHMSRVYSLAAEVRKAKSPVTTFLRERFPHLSSVAVDFRQQVEGLPTIQPKPTARPTPYAMIGAALDYRLRYYFRQTIIESTDAFRGAQSTHIRSPDSGECMESVPVSAVSSELAIQIQMTALIPRVARDFFDSLRVLIPKLHPVRRILKPEDELLLSRFCYILALFEQEGRLSNWPKPWDSPLTRLPPDTSFDELLALPEEEWVKDIGRMAWLFGKRHFNLFYAKVRVNPKFLSGVGGFGADAELLIDGYLIDVKTALHPVLEPAWMYQVLGYVLLASPSTMTITGVGFYLARQGVFVRWPLDTLLPRLTGSCDVPLKQLRDDSFNVLLTKLDYR
jgi:hypothetical protein